jgi:hypothetical protein
MTSGHDRAFYSGKHKRHGLNVQVIADPIGRLVWISPVLPGALWVPETLRTSCDLLIFVELSAEPVAALDGVRLA